MTETVHIAVIGGSGLYNMPEITDKTSVALDTPFGKPSAEIVIGTLSGRRVAFLPRHGIGHVYTPTTVPYRANIYALKSLGVRFVIGVNACGSLREDYAPGHIVIPAQLFDYTTLRLRSFFDDGLVAHVSVAQPFCPTLSDVLYQALVSVGGTAHAGGTFLIEEGPRFATKAESNIFRQWGCDLIGMTTAPEAFLAREAEMCYSAIAHVTDYDVWHQSEEPVTTSMVIAQMKRNVAVVQQAIAAAVPHIDEDANDACQHALDDAIATDAKAISHDVLERLKPIVARRFRM